MFNININPILALLLVIFSFSTFAAGGEYGGRFNTGILSYYQGNWYWDPMPSNCSRYNTGDNPGLASGVPYWCASGPIGYAQGFNYLPNVHLYPDDKSCSVKITFIQAAGGRNYNMDIYSGTIAGMTKSGNTFVSNSGSFNCRDYIQQAGISWGYFQDLDIRGPSIWQNYGFINYIIEAMDVSWNGGGNISTVAHWPLNSSPNDIPPVPASCSVSIPPELNHGVVSVDAYSDAIGELQILCNKTASLSLSFANSNMPYNLSLGGNVVSTVCFIREDDCVTGQEYNLSGNSNYTTLIRSRLSGTGWAPGNYEGNVIVFLSYQ